MPPVPSNLHVHPDSPRILSLADGEVVHQRALLLHGRAGYWSNEEAYVTISSHPFGADYPSSPPQTWLVSKSHFKGIILLENGPQTLSITYHTSSRYVNVSSMSAAEATISLVVTYTPLPTPPLHLAILVASDSALRIDTPRSHVDHGDLDTVARKLRVAALLWQALTAECMRAANMGRRSFRLEEYVAKDTLYACESSAQVRAQPIVHIVRSNLTTAQLRNPHFAQQNKHGNDTGRLFGVFLDALTQYGGPFMPSPGNPAPVVSGLILDSTYDPAKDLIVAHAALGGNGGPGGNLHLGMFGSHLCWAWPTTMDEVGISLLDVTRPPAGQVGNDSGEAGSAWEAAALGMGAMLHEAGHAFGCCHQPNGIMARGYVDFPRTFLSKTAHSSRNKPGRPTITPSTPNDNVWHLSDMLLFRQHPAFAHPNDKPLLVGNLKVIYSSLGLEVCSKAGIAMLEWHVRGGPTKNDRFGPGTSVEAPERVFLSVADLDRISTQSSDTSLVVRAIDGKQKSVPDVWALIRGARFAGPHGDSGLSVIGTVADNEGNDPQHRWASLLGMEKKGRVVLATRVGKRSGAWLDNLSIDFGSGHITQSAPPRHSNGTQHQLGGGAFTYELPREKSLVALRVKVGSLVDDVEFEFESGTKPSGVEEDLCRLTPPLGQKIVGFAATHAIDDSYCPVKSVAIICAPEGANIDAAMLRAVNGVSVNLAKTKNGVKKTGRKLLGKLLK